MNRTLHFISRYPLSTVTVIAIWVLCLMPIPETPLDDVPFMDKWTHFVMYGGLCSVLWIEYVWRNKKRKASGVFLYCCLLPLLMGGLIEIVQATCTGGRRSGDWIDFLADGIGVLIGQAIGSLLVWCLAKACRD